MQKHLHNFGQDKKVGSTFLTQKADNHSNVNIRQGPNNFSNPENFSKIGFGFEQPCYLIMTISPVHLPKKRKPGSWSESLMLYKICPFIC